MRRNVRNLAYRERHLARVAAAAGQCFGCASEGAEARMALPRRSWMATLFAPLMLLAPAMTSAAWYWRE